KYFDHDSSVFSNDSDAHDSWDQYRGGFRVDVEPSHENGFTFQGDIYSGQEDENYTVPTETFPFASRISSTDNFAGGNLLARWPHNFDTESAPTLPPYSHQTCR